MSEMQYNLGANKGQPADSTEVVALSEKSSGEAPAEILPLPQAIEISSRQEELKLAGLEESAPLRQQVDDKIPEPPTVEVPYGEALETLMDKKEYTDRDIEVLVAYARQRRREQAARELKARMEADARAAKKAAKEAKAKAKTQGSQNADEGGTA